MDEQIDALAGEVAFDARLDRLEEQLRTAAVRLAWLREQVELWIAEATSDEDG